MSSPNLAKYVFIGKFVDFFNLRGIGVGIFEFSLIPRFFVE